VGFPQSIYIETCFLDCINIHFKTTRQWRYFM